ncbi:putative Protein kinase domain-containing protein [Seiridium unicorne]|uniref:Protein kinase domain-containing protein n=1 Tax=Seiridium unicorne TaxID=138068 RepID=A0ABR2UJD2_9PEZI
MNKAVSSCRMLGVKTRRVAPSRFGEYLLRNRLRLTPFASKFLIPTTKGPDHGECYALAIKTSSKSNHNIFDSEKDAYAAMQGNSRRPPVLREEILRFWKSLFNVAAALKEVHGLKHKNEYGQDEDFDGWHADIKLDNILRVENVFKLADFGFAK